MDTILIVEDEASVRATLTDWLKDSKLELELIVASDAAGALEQAGRQPIDLAILDWNLGAGLNGLQLLEDLHEFQRDLVAILVTGYAHKATPLDALRLGVRDYLDKSHDFTRDRFLASVRKQLDRIRPLKRERLIRQQLERFRAVVGEALPRLETASVLQQDGATLDQIVAGLLRFVQKMTCASAGLLVVRQFMAQNAEPEQLQVYDLTGQRRTDLEKVRFAQSLAAAISSLAPDAFMSSLSAAHHLGSVKLSTDEARHQQLLGITLHNSPSLMVVLELFDKEGTNPAFVPADRDLLMSWQPMASVILKMVLGERESQKMLYETLAAALQESEQFAGSLRESGAAHVASQVFTSKVSQAGTVAGTHIDEWAQILQRLSQRYGTSAVGRILQVLQSVEGLLDDVTHLPAN